MELRIRERCADCGGEGKRRVGAPGGRISLIACASCKRTGWIEEWLPLSDVLKIGEENKHEPERTH